MKELDYYYMGLALQAAQEAFERGEIPVGAIVVAEGQILGKGQNYVEQFNDPTAHAEMIALTSACHYKGSRYLNDATLYVTLEPCPMCAGAIFWGQLARLVYAAPDEKRGFSTLASPLLHPKTLVTAGVRREESEALLKAFFRTLRG